MTDLQVKMAEHLEKVRANKAQEAIKERENAAKYDYDYIPYDNLENWDPFSTRSSYIGEGFSDKGLPVQVPMGAKKLLDKLLENFTGIAKGIAR